MTRGDLRNALFFPSSKVHSLSTVLYTIKTKNSHFSSFASIFLFLTFIFISGLSNAAYSQVLYQSNNFTQNQQYNNNYMSRSTAFKQEIARMEINVIRNGKETLPITQVPRLQKSDVVTVRLLEEQVNGIKPDQSNYDWSFLMTFINPARNNDKQTSVSEEIQFRKTGWYREYSFVVPYDSQPIFFLYPKPKYREKILNLINKNQDDIRKIGEKTIDISDAYGKIGTFLNELQSVLNRSSYYGGYGNYGGSYGSYSYNPYNTYTNPYNGLNTGINNLPFNYNAFVEQTIERLASSFNIPMPACWNNGNSPYNSGYNNYNGYNTGYNNYGNNNYNYNNGNNNNLGYRVSQDLVGRAQCVARNVRLEDFDLSVSKLLQQGGILAVAQLNQKYPQLAYWINIAAAALDFILKLTKKTPLRLVPTVVSTLQNQGQLNPYQPQNYNYQQNYGSTDSNTSNSAMYSPNPVFGAKTGSDTVKISLYAETSPSDNGFVTAYPLVIHKWQPESDPEVIGLPTPMLADQCLRPGQNILKSTDLMNDWTADNFTKDFQLVISSSNGFRKTFPLRKNLGLNAWELNLTKEDINAFPKINMTLDSVIVGKRGFNEIRSPKFDLPVPVGNSWEIVAESQKTFAVGGKRLVTVKNQLGNCRCLQAVVYKPSFGGQFVFEVNSKENGLYFSPDGKEVSFEIDATNFQPGPGQLELRQFGGEMSNLNITLHAPPPVITDIKMARGDNEAVIYGERLEQLEAVKINGKRAVVKERGLSPAQNANPGAERTANQNEHLAATANTGGVTAVPQTQVMIQQNEVKVIFEDANARQDSNNIQLELQLSENRNYQYPKTFPVSLSRPSIVATVNREIEAAATVNNKLNQSQFKLANLPVFPIDSSEINLIVQNALTDYDFKAENILVEARIENGQLSQTQLMDSNFEVLDWKNLKINIRLNEQIQKLLGGRRLQFRIRDKVRGDSNWYTIKQTFVRAPKTAAVKCGTGVEVKGSCEISGEGIEYISQVSTDGGKTWFPESPATLTVQTNSRGSKFIAVPKVPDKRLLKIRLRDFSTSEGFAHY